MLIGIKRIIVLLISVALLFTLCACGNNNGEDENKDQAKESITTQSQQATENVIDAYKVPAEFSKLDLSKEDPSTADMRFIYNEDGSVHSCIYNIDNSEVAVTYSYTGNQIQIYAFSGTIVVADEKYTAKSQYDSSIGFVEYKGYYFKGFEF